MKTVRCLVLESNRGNRGFTLVELLLALGIAGMISAFAISISSSISGLSKQAMTKVRMETIAAKARQYYRSHKAQAAAIEREVGTKTTWSVPVGASAFNLEAKYRFDGWGHFLYYQVCKKSDLENISDFNLKSSSVKYGAVIISSGPNQLFGPNSTNAFVNEITDEDDDFDKIYKDSSSSKYVVAVKKSDDIILWVSFNQEATEIALEELQVLQSKVEAFDAMFEGVDNDGDKKVDNEVDNGNESGLPRCGAYSGVIECYDGSSISGAVADPNCGRATLDAIEKGTFTCDCKDDGNVVSMNACCFLKKMFGLSNQYLTDPWGHDYQWSIDSIDPADPAKLKHYKNLRHHKFWSLGSDGSSELLHDENDVTFQDDIVY